MRTSFRWSISAVGLDIPPRFQQVFQRRRTDYDILGQRKPGGERGAEPALETAQ